MEARVGTDQVLSEAAFSPSLWPVVGTCMLHAIMPLEMSGLKW
jgi:hypothetical protein